LIRLPRDRQNCKALGHSREPPVEHTSRPWSRWI